MVRYAFKALSVAFLLSFSFSAFSQIKIGDNPTLIDDNSILELEHTNKGVLIPRVLIPDLTTEDPLTAPVPEGTLVFNIDAATENGFYYWDGASWQRLLTDVNSNQRDNYVLVKSVADLPAPSGGIITLAAGVVYEINGTITLTDQIDINDAYIEGRDATNDILMYTPATGSLFTGDQGGTIKILTLSAPSVGAKVFDLDDAAGTENIIVRDCNIGASDNIGNIKGYKIAYLSVINYAANKNGITYEDIDALLLENMAWFSTNENVFESFVGDFELIQKIGGFSTTLLANSATAVDVSGISTILSGSMKSVDYAGDGIRITGSFSKEWEVASSGITTETDDVAGGNIYLSTPTTTSISGSDDPTKISGTTATANLFRFTSAVDNQMVYAGTKTRTFQIFAAISMTSPANNKIYQFHIAKNGSIVPGTAQSRKIASGSDVGALSISGVVELSTGDYVEVWVENISDGSNITIESMNLTVR